MRLSTRQVERREHLGAKSSPAEEWFETPWGRGLATVWERRLLGVELPPIRGGDSRRASNAVTQEDREILVGWISELEAYFRGERLSWRLEELDLDGRGLTPFGLRTMEVLMEVPAGSTISYGALAALAGFPRAARAVGSLMANNPTLIVIPCHRVIRSDGNLGRYGSDSTWKERLLTHERENIGQR